MFALGTHSPRGRSWMVPSGEAAGIMLSSILVPYWAVAWLLVPLYLKKIKWSFIVGIIFVLIAMIGITAMPEVGWMH